MARISPQELEGIKAEVSLVRLVEQAGVMLKPHGEDFIGLCPFHDDHEPSLVITPAKNLWHCLGACQTGGSVIDWVMKREGVSFRHAVELLREGIPTLVASSTTPVKRSRAQKLPTAFSTEQEEQVLLDQVIDYYHQTLLQSPDALAYLDKRGLNNPDMIHHFKLGFANRTLAYRLPEKNRMAGAAIRGQLQRIGLLRSSGHEHFNGSLVIPVFDAQGHVMEVYGRKITPKLRPGTPLHLYLPGPHKGIFNFEALQANKEIILCESLIDALTFWVNGYRNVTCSYGISGFTDEHLAALQEHAVERVLIAYDRDAAGEQAATQLSQQLCKQGIACYRIQFPKGMDANEYALQVTPASKSLGVVIRSAQWLGEGQAQAPGAPLSDNPLPVAGARLSVKEDVAIVEETAQDHQSVESTPAPSPVATNPNPSTTPTEPTTEHREPTTLPATPLPDPPKAEIPVKINGEEIELYCQDRRYRVRGLQNNLSVNQLKVNVLVSKDAQLHVDTFDLYAARLRQSFIQQAATELGVKEAVIKKDLGQVLLRLEALQEELLQKTLQSKPVVEITDVAKQAALQWLQSKDLLQRLLQDFNRCGVVGENTNKLVGYLAAVSRKLDKPLAVMVQSSSAAGKSSLMESILAFVPEEDKVQYSAMTGQSLYYMEDGDLKHKILAIAEEEGAERASYALKLLQSEGQLSIASTGKDPQSGRLITHQYQVEGPVMIFSTTTSIEPDEELLNRCIVLGVDEGRAQTQAIHAQQRQARTLAGLVLKKEKQGLMELHQNAQRLLKPLAVINPYADQLTFLDDRTRLRRDHEKYLTLIDTIALLHQYQRPRKWLSVAGSQLSVTESRPLADNREPITEHIEYIEVQRQDIAMANELAHEILGKSLDELPPQSRRLLLLIEQMVNECCEAFDISKTDYRFSRKDVREYTGWTDFQVKTHMNKLAQLEYVLAYRGGRGQCFVYELLYDGKGKDGQPFLMGLINIDQLKPTYDEQKEHTKSELALPSSPQGGCKEQASRQDESDITSCNYNDNTQLDNASTKKPLLPNHHNNPHRSPTPIPSLAAHSQHD